MNAEQPSGDEVTRVITLKTATPEQSPLRKFGASSSMRPLAGRPPKRRKREVVLTQSEKIAEEREMVRMVSEFMQRGAVQQLSACYADGSVDTGALGIDL